MLITTAAPRLDRRLVQFVAGARLGTPAADVTRSAGELAWALGLPRPSYEQVRFLLRRLRPLTSMRRLQSPTPGRGRRRRLRTAIRLLASALRNVEAAGSRSARRVARWWCAIAAPS